MSTSVPHISIHTCIWRRSAPIGLSHFCFVLFFPETNIFISDTGSYKKLCFKKLHKSSANKHLQLNMSKTEYFISIWYLLSYYLPFMRSALLPAFPHRKRHYTTYLGAWARNLRIILDLSYPTPTSLARVINTISKECPTPTYFSLSPHSNPLLESGLSP